MADRLLDSGRLASSSRLPVSTSRYVLMSRPPNAARWRSIADSCPSRPRPDSPCLRVETRMYAIIASDIAESLKNVD